MEDAKESSAAADVSEQLKVLEYAIRRSILVREDQEDDAEPQNKIEAQRCGIAVENLHTKGELLNAVQTAVRAIQKNSSRGENKA